MKTDLVIALIAAILTTAAFADRTVTEKAPDGVNTVTKTVNDAGYVTSEAMTLAFVPQKYVPPTDDENDEAKQSLIDILDAANEKAKERATDEAIVSEVFGENPTNSSFVTRRELTATQKRFIALGHKYAQLAIAYLRLESRVRDLELEAANRRGKITMEVR